MKGGILGPPSSPGGRKEAPQAPQGTGWEGSHSFWGFACPRFGGGGPIAFWEGPSIRLGFPCF